MTEQERIQHRAEVREHLIEQDKRTAFMRHLYHTYGRNNPDHPLHGHYSGLWQDFKEEAAYIVREQFFDRLEAVRLYEEEQEKRTLMFTPAPIQNQTPTPLPQENQQQPEAKKQPAKKKASAKGNVDTFVQTLTGLAAYIHELQIQSHLIHLNYEANNFLAVHKFLKKQYELHLKEFDDIGEYVRSMDYLLPMCHEGLMDANKEFDHVKSYAPEEMLMTYYKNLENLGMMSKKIQESARKLKAIDIENYMAELCGNAFKSAWMIKATLRKG